MPDRQSTRLFRTFKGNAPAGVIPDGPTVQGVYCMTAAGDFLAGRFACASGERARRVLEGGWERWSRLAKEHGYQPRPVPRTPLDPVPGRKLPPGSVRLEIAVRDLPRGEERRPGREAWHRGAFNLGWVELTEAEARAFVTTEREKRVVPVELFEKLALKSLKDSVRGQCSDWRRSALQEGRLETQCIGKEANRLTMRLTGSARLEQSGRGYECRLHGEAVYDTVKRQLVRFELVAAGQRRGGDEFNFRQDDLAPAPMGVAYVLHKGTAGE